MKKKYIAKIIIKNKKMLQLVSYKIQFVMHLGITESKYPYFVHFVQV